ncbi:MAG: sugar transferase [Pseudomonadota bacterium]
MTLHVSNLSTDAQAELHTPAVRRSTAPFGPYGRFFKRLIDLTLVLLSAPFVLPLILLLALAIALTGNAPFYTQQRVGRGGVPFRMWKLRTMVNNADQHLESYLAQSPEARAEWDQMQKLKNDPRITPLGRLLRKASMDELPQLFNVFNGTMSLVGPRPMMVGQEKDYFGQAYYELRPGITGLWQVSDRNECCFQDRVAYDTTYSRQMSLKTDVSILLKTLGVVWRGTGY